MKIAITGSSGLIGNAIKTALVSRGDQVVELQRGKDWQCDLAQSPEHDYANASAFENCDGVIHLSGEPIAQGRWNDAKKKAIRDSRVRGTAVIARTLAQLPEAHRPRVFIVASATGYYGSRGDLSLSETADQGQGFLADTCKQWEDAAAPASQAGIRVVNIRLGLVLAKEGGALAKMLPVFKLGGGGTLGGAQYWSWITLTDVTAATLFLLDRNDVHGPVNLVSPQPVTNQRFTQVLGRTLKRPTFIPVPAIALRLAMGEMADELLLSSARVEPAVLQGAGFNFEHPQLDEALRWVIG